MITDFKEIIHLARKEKPKIISVAAAHDEDVLKAIKCAYEAGIIKGILVGERTKIEQIANEIKLDLREFEIVNEVDLVECCRLAVEKVTLGQAHMLMKGLVDTSIILKAVLNKEANLRTGRVLSHVGVIAAPTHNKVLLVSDAAMNIAPTLEAKKQIVENTVLVAHAIGLEEPKVAIICAKEKVNPKMPATVDAKALEEMNQSGEITGCIVGGPFGLDNAVSKEAARIKGMDHPVAGDADILILPSIESGNVLYKALSFIGDAEAAGIIAGSKVPIILTSRADSDITKLNSIALAMLMASN